MEKIKIRLANQDDISLLAHMYRILVEDEKAPELPDISDCEAKMIAFLDNVYIAYIFYNDETILGYALVDHSTEPLYLKHFMINRENRRNQNGTKTFNLLLNHLGINTIEIEVFHWNERGKKFWNSLGFKPKHIRMIYEKE